jgi:acyl-ACP thioesterase
VEELVPAPLEGRTFRGTRRVRLSDRDVQGRLRLDAVARYLQDLAGDDVDETGWGAPDHLWVLRRVRIDVVAPLIGDREVELVTWCSGTAAIAAGRRMSLTGDRSGRIEVDSVWIHLGPDAKPARIEGFDVYAQAAGSRVVSTRLELPEPPSNRERIQWPLRMSDIDLLGHVNNAAYWKAVEQCLLQADLDLRRPARALLDYRHAIDLDDHVELVTFSDGQGFAVAFATGDVLKAVAWVEEIA